MKGTKQSGFTLVEILIVVVIMGILAAIVVPKFSQSSDDARVSSTVQNLQILRTQIDLYRNQHTGLFPGTPAGSVDDTVFVEQMTLPTNAAGDRGAFGDPNFRFGPYINNRLPHNPYNRSRKVETVLTFPVSAPAGTTANPTNPGWIYEITSGRFKFNWGGTTPSGDNMWDL